jgi:transposase InsO family protein
LVEKQTGNQVKALRSDNGGEFVSAQFKEFCKREGIHRWCPTLYTPQQNGVVERRNRTVMEMARCMVHSRNVPYRYRADIVNTAVYILNKSPCKACQKSLTKNHGQVENVL